MLTLTKLKQDIEASQGFLFFAIKVRMEGFPEPEIIVNRMENAEAKIAYYEKVYNEDLTLKAFNGIKIIDMWVGDYLECLEYDLCD